MRSSSVRPLKRSAALALACTIGAVCNASAVAQDAYPSRPLRIIVHTLPASSSDTVTRLFAEALGARLKQTVVVENRAGAGGAIGVQAAVKASPDGYTLLAGASSAMVLLPLVYRKPLAYDVERDLTPIGVGSRSTFLLLAHENSRLRSVADLIARAKSSPDKITYGSAGAGTNPHLLGELLQQLANIRLLHVPYKGPGAAQMDLLGGSIDLQFDTPTSALHHVQAGRLRALTVTAEARLPQLPDLPAAGELGFPTLIAYGWTAIYAPRAVPPAIVNRLRVEAKEILSSPKLVGYFQATGQQVAPLIGDDLTRMWRQHRELWRGVIEARKLYLD